MSSRSTRITAALIAVTAGAGALIAAPLLADGGGPSAPHTDHHQQPVGNPLAPQVQRSPGQGANVGVGATLQPPDDAADPGAQDPQGPKAPKGAPPAPDAPNTRDDAGRGRGRQFRVTCDFVKSGMFDPIVFPGTEMAGHNHQFFGNTSIAFDSTTASLVAANATGTATSCNRTADGAAYWVPALQADGTDLTPDEATISYRAPRGVRRVRAFPAGLTMIAGDKTATTQQAHAGYRCEFDAPGTALQASPPTCSADEDIIGIVTFPNCWDGKNLSSSDQSHVIYAVAGARCPTDHPVTVPELRMETYWPSDGQAHTFTLSSGNTAGLHADFMNGWDQATLNRLVRRWGRR